VTVHSGEDLCHGAQWWRFVWRCTVVKICVTVHSGEDFYLNVENDFSSSYVSLTVHLSITLTNDQLDARIFNTFITILYVYMFRAISCSSSGDQSVL